MHLGKKISILFSTPGGGLFSRAPPFVEMTGYPFRALNTPSAFEAGTSLTVIGSLVPEIPILSTAILLLHHVATTAAKNTAKVPINNRSNGAWGRLSLAWPGNHHTRNTAIAPRTA